MIDAKRATKQEVSGRERARDRSTEPRILIIGAGIVGLALAWRLRCENASVVIVDPEPPGIGGASFGNAGAISPHSIAPLAMPGLLGQVPRMLLDKAAPLHVPASYVLRAAPWLLRFIFSAREASVTSAAAALHALLRHAVEQHLALAEQIGAPELIQQKGQLHLYRSPAQLMKDVETWALRKSYGISFEALERADIAALEPAVGPDYRHGIFLPHQAHCISPAGYTRAIAAAFVKAGGEIARDRIRRLTFSETGISGAAGETASYHADHVVLAAGAWSTQLLKPLGYRIPLESQRGYHVDFPSSGIQLSRPTVAADRKVFFSPMMGGLRVAGTVEFGGLGRPANPARAALLHRDAATVFPQVKLEGAAGFWMGHRPCLPDSLPVLGPAQRIQRLWFAFGHGHLGLTGSAPTAALLASAILGRSAAIDVSAFSAERFR